MSRADRVLISSTVGVVLLILCCFLIFVVTKSFGNPLSQITGNGIEVPALPIGTCNDANYFKQLSANLGRWADASQRAGSTARIALTSVIGDMQQIRRDHVGLAHPGCANKLHDLVTNSMNDEIDAYLLFMQQASDAAVTVKLNRAAGEMDDALAEWKRLGGSGLPQ